MINDRHPEIARIILDAIHDEGDVDGIQALLSSAVCVRDAGFTTAEEEAQHGEVEPNQPRHGWQSRVVREVESRSLHAIREVLPIPQQALLRSQEQGRVPKPSGNRRWGALGESDSSEAQILRDVLKQARRSAQEQPISAQIKDTEEFIATSTNSVGGKTQGGGAIVEGCCSPVGQVAHPTALDMQVAELKVKWPLWKRNKMHKMRRGCVESPSVARWPCCREEFIPNCDEAMVLEVARVSHLLMNAAQEWHELIQQQSGGQMVLFDLPVWFERSSRLQPIEECGVEEIH